ncbi:MAG: hypothetical protein L0207_05440 [Chlamydiae bacterium]|nr:hypothetical protein [Chlamydiota bacterium]
MWARVIEFTIACWLAMSPFIFHYPKTDHLLWINDFSCAMMIAIFSLFSFKKSLRKIHLFNLVISLWLIGIGYATENPKSIPPIQNYVTVGLFLLLIAIVPSESQLPPYPWRVYRHRKRERLKYKG